MGKKRIIGPVTCRSLLQICVILVSLGMFHLNESLYHCIYAVVSYCNKLWYERGIN